MEALAALLGLTGLLGLIGGVIWLFVALIRRKALRKPGILSGVGFLIFVFALILTPSTDSDSQVQLNNKEQSVNITKPTPTPTPSDDDVLARIVTRTLGSSNREVERVKSITLDDLERHLVIEWSINDNITGGLRKSGTKRDVLGVLEAIRDSTIDFSQVTMRGSLRLVDVYGNANEGDVVRVSYDKDTMDRVNFDNVRTDNAWIIADESWIHPAFRD